MQKLVMIHKITIENFFSIADCQEIEFTVPGNAPDLPCFRRPLADKEMRLPTVVGFFGPNASGKTTILRAVYSAVMFACKSFGNENAGIIFQSYRQKKWLEKPTKIIIDFCAKIDENSKYSMFRYELHISHNAENFQNKKVAYEALSYAPKGKYRSLFERNEQSFYFGEEFDISNNKEDPRKSMIGPNFSVISTLSISNHPLASYICMQMGLLQMSGFVRQNSSEDLRQVFKFLLQK